MVGEYSSEETQINNFLLSKVVMDYDKLSSQTKCLLHTVSESIGQLESMIHSLKSSSELDEINKLYYSLNQDVQNISSNCDRLSTLLSTVEPYSRRSQLRLSLDQTRFECKQYETNLRVMDRKKNEKWRSIVEREELLSHDFSTNASVRNDCYSGSTVVRLDPDLEHYSRLSNVSKQIDDMLVSGSFSLSALQEQGMTLKSAQRRIMDVLNTLGLSNTVMRLIERRSHQDKQSSVAFIGYRFKSCLLHVLSKDDEYWKRLSTKRLLIPKLLSLISSEKEYLKLSVLNEISEEDIVEIPELIDYFAFIQPSKQDGIIKTSTSLSMYIMLCLEKLMKISKCQRILRNHNGISILLNQLKGCLQFQSTVNTTNIIMKMSNSSTYNVKTSEECFNEMKLVHDLDEDIVQCNIAICGILSQLAMDDFYAQIITRENGIHLIGSQLLIKYPKNAEKQSTIDESQLKPTSEVNDQQTLNTKHFNTANIRHLYLTSKVNCCYISIRNHELLNKFFNEEYNELLNGIISCDVNRTPIHYIREYSVLELLGTGAYGKVFKASKNTIPHNNYAIKKVSTSQIFFGRNPNERQKCIDRILNEVNVIRQQLRHPNIVRYYKTFLDSDNLYIVMELLDGVSLTELLASFKEKSIHLVESRIWDIFIQLVLGLRYLHKEKKILHRDLSSNNIMIGEGYKVTITDFGLAHHKTLNSSEIKSTVGTLFYACPEMVQCIPYGEGADIWALGCILYQMCTFTSPFQGECILSTASRIVKGEYESVETKCPNQYSNLIDQVIQVCLKPDPIERPDIIGKL
ncbi:Serine/threonine-protein kinase Nek10 isoform 1 [Schistosoma japonicum]|uniref:Serine/threonine-protein kinase Nek10 isoform 1 n=1 Tax=Schistosoma japonicum TaxID=6182 RepID=A0A4Z2D6P3_SCHJA|nr:Serine/threonine-protein kinase Nek10 isoform 1 [Schistosoma japonicum]